jgi:hypothetical protein
MSVNLSIDAEAMKNIVAETILAKFSPAQREDLLKQAVAFILTPDKTGSSYSNRSYGKSPFDLALEQGAYTACCEIIREEFKKPEMRAMLTKPLVAALQKCFDDSNNELVSNMATLISRALTPRPE